MPLALGDDEESNAKLNCEIIGQTEVGRRLEVKPTTKSGYLLHYSDEESSQVGVGCGKNNQQIIKSFEEIFRS